MRTYNPLFSNNGTTLRVPLIWYNGPRRVDFTQRYSRTWFKNDDMAESGFKTTSHRGSFHINGTMGRSFKRMVLSSGVLNQHSVDRCFKMVHGALFQINGPRSLIKLFQINCPWSVVSNVQYTERCFKSIVYSTVSLKKRWSVTLFWNKATVNLWF